MNEMEVEQLSLDNSPNLLPNPGGSGQGRTWINYVFSPVLNGLKSRAFIIAVISVIIAAFFWVDGTTVVNQGLLRKTYDVVVVDPSPNVVVIPNTNVIMDPTPNPPANNNELGHHKNNVKNKRREHMIRRKDEHGKGPISRFVSIMGFTEDDKLLITLLFSIPRISFLFGIIFSVYKAIRRAWGTLKFAYKAYVTGRNLIQNVSGFGQGRRPGTTLSVLKSRSFFIGLISAVLFIASFYIDSTSIINERLLRKTIDVKPLITLLFSIPRISFLFGIFFSVYKAIRQAWGTLKFAYKTYDTGRKALQKLERVGKKFKNFVPGGNNQVDRGRRPGRILSVLKSRSFLIGVISTTLFVASFYVDSTFIINEGLLRKTYDVVDPTPLVDPTPNPLSNSVAGKGVASTQADDHVVVSHIDGSQITTLTDDDGVVVGKEAITMQVANRVVTKPTDHDGVVTDQGING